MWWRCPSVRRSRTSSEKGRRSRGIQLFPAMRKAGEDGLVWTVIDLWGFLSKPSRKVSGTTIRFRASGVSKLKT